MSDNDKSTCPVCFTRMRNINRVLTCPECGYKYCDHNRDLQDMFDTTHTHAPNYTTYTNNTASSQNKTSTTNTYSNAGKTTYTRTSSSTGTATSKKSVAKVVKIIIIIYLIATFCPMICGILGMAITSGIALFSESSDDYETPEIVISSDLPEDVESSIDIDAILEDIGVSTSGAGEAESDSTEADIDMSAPIDLEAEDGEFVPELIKYMFNVSDFHEVTNQEISTVYFLDIRTDMSYGTFAYYYTTDGQTGQFTFESSEIDAADLNAFIGLDYLYTPNISYQANDLNNLHALRTLCCQNTPLELTEVVNDPSQLTDLSLMLPYSTTTLMGLEQFGNLEDLELYAENTYVTEADQIAELQNLNILTYVDGGTLQNFDFLNKLPGINHLYLSAEHLSDLSFVENMPELRSLEFENTGVSDLSPLISVSDTLTSLTLSYNTHVTDFSPLAEMTALQFLAASSCELTDIGFASSLRNLTFLNIQNNQVTSLEPLKDLISLQNLYIDDNPIEDYAGLEYLCN